MVEKKGLNKTIKLIDKIENAYWGPNLDNEEIFKYIQNKSFAVAVSGGSDSLCLAYFS